MSSLITRTESEKGCKNKRLSDEPRRIVYWSKCFFPLVSSGNFFVGTGTCEAEKEGLVAVGISVSSFGKTKTSPVDKVPNIKYS